MREKIFRGKRIDNGKWIYGDLLQDGDTDAFIATRYTAYEDGFCQVFGESVDPLTVGQYTGRTDKNYNKIFTDDILFLLVDKENVKVVDDQGSCAFLIMSFDGFDDPYYLGDMISSEIEIVGNVWDNPRLMEVQK